MKADKGKFISIGGARKSTGRNVNLRGWVYRIRQGKGIVFLVLRDSTGIMQCVIKEAVKCGFQDYKGRSDKFHKNGRGVQQQNAGFYLKIGQQGCHGI